MRAAMDAFQLLQVTAQIAVATAGFGGIASALKHQQRADDTRVDAGRLIHMLIVCFGATVISLVPCVLALFGLAERDLWRASSAVALVFIAVLSPPVVIRSTRMAKFAGFSWPTYILNLALLALSGIAFALAAFGVPASGLAGSYLLGVLFLLCTVAVSFYRVMTSQLRPHLPD